MKSIVNKISLWMVALIVSALHLASCTGVEPDVVPGGDEGVVDPGVEMVDVSFYVGSESGASTKVYNPSATNESKINRWALLLVKSGESTVYKSYTSSSSAGISVTVPVGTYTAYAVVNYPTSGTGAFTPQDGMAVSDVTGHVSYVYNNSPTNLVMFGSKSISLVKGTNSTQSIPVVRLVAKLGIKKITFNLNAIDFIDYPEIKSIYVTNTYLNSTFGSDYSVEQMANMSNWHNRMGHETNSVIDALMYCSLNLTTEGNEYEDFDEDENWVIKYSPININQYFYCYQNRVLRGADSTSSTWCKRCTRMVIEVDIDGTSYYYPITIASNSKGVLRNNTYIAENVIISNYGSLDPEGESVYSPYVEVIWSTDLQGWDGPVTVNETS